MESAILQRSFSVRLDAHYLLRPPDTLNSDSILVVALHGFGANPETMLEHTARLFDERAVLAALQGPNQFFTDTTQREVGYGWVTSRHSSESIRLHRDLVMHVLHEAGSEFGIPPERRILVGFSQAVALNYRFAAACPKAVGGVLGICGGLPGDWESGSHHAISAAVLHIARSEDEYYPPAVTETFAGRLRQHAADVEFHLVEGGHAMPSKGNRIVAPWLERILQGDRGKAAHAV